MSRFVNNRRIVLLYCAVSIAAGNMVLGSPQSAYADGWAELLKPLVKDVIVPGASMGMKKLMERNNKKQQSDESKSKSEDSGSTDNSWADSAFSSPEEPISTGSGDDMIMSTPEEPISFSSQQTSPMDPPPPPPPPVETP
jgi:hypothetical protein